MRLITRSYVWLLVAVLVCVGSADAGFHFGVRVGSVRTEKTSNVEGSTLSSHKDIFKHWLYNMVVFAGCGYSILKILELSGQVHLGLNGDDSPFKGDYTIKDSDGSEYDVTSNLSIKNKYNFGGEIILGLKPISRIMAYGLGGVNVNVVRPDGSMSASKVGGSEKSVLFFSDSAASLQNVAFDSIKQSNKFCLQFTLGGGVRFYISKVFFGVEGRYYFNKSSALSLKGALSDPSNVFGFAKTSGTKVMDNLKIALKDRSMCLSLVLGIAL